MGEWSGRKEGEKRRCEVAGGESKVCGVHNSRPVASNSFGRFPRGVENGVQRDVLGEEEEILDGGGGKSLGGGGETQGGP